MLKRIVVILSTLIIALSLVLDVFSAEELEETISISASSAVLIDESGNIIMSRDPDVRRPMASTTKIMTALVCIENISLDKKVKIPKEAVGIEGSSIYLVENEVLTVSELLYALMLRSANDAAAALAIEVGGSIEGFAQMMNAKASELGLKDTHFDNPHGLDSEQHYTTAYELALITAEALKNDFFRTLTGTYKKTIPLNGEEGTRLLVNHNRLLKSYNGCIGVKTGFTKKCGRCLVSAAERDGLTLICVTLNAPDDWRDHTAMLDYGFSNLEKVTLDGRKVSGYIPVVGSKNENIRYVGDGETEVILKKDRGEIRAVTEMRRFYYAPLKSGDVIGRVAYYLDGDLIAQVPIKAISDAPSVKEKKGLFSLIKNLFK